MANQPFCGEQSPPVGQVDPDYMTEEGPGAEGVVFLVLLALLCIGLAMLLDALAGAAGGSERPPPLHPILLPKSEGSKLEEEWAEGCRLGCVFVLGAIGAFLVVWFWQHPGP